MTNFSKNPEVISENKSNVEFLRNIMRYFLNFSSLILFLKLEEPFDGFWKKSLEIFEEIQREISEGIQTRIPDNWQIISMEVVENWIP